MTQVAPLPAAMNNSLYGANNNNSEERETGSGFEVGLYFNRYNISRLLLLIPAQFTRRKRWPHLLLQELVGSALFCLKPVIQNQGSSHSSLSGYGWKVCQTTGSLICR